MCAERAGPEQPKTPEASLCLHSPYLASVSSILGQRILVGSVAAQDAADTPRCWDRATRDVLCCFPIAQCLKKAAGNQNAIKLVSETGIKCRQSEA